MKIFQLLAAAAGVFLLSASAMAQGPVQGVLEACKTEITTYCDQVTPGNGRMLSCMYAHEDKISDTCAASIVDLADALDFLFANVSNAVALCAADIEANCSNVEFGGGRILSCLKANADKVSAECQPVVSSFSEQFGLGD
ncbi:cysteine rich repeat-containing protein [Roseibium sp. Sym1]|uniref:cysteine rich repeat-containing protein n=1 Tax=Roseibium sp. Sym1 TaxID=3016006 RepID=UPI0022B50D07|nr:cysteine rich repeat-containing protein [Roseibium sp. Sym1]